MTSKILKLQDLGVDITDLQWLINLRNEYIHTCHIYAGYCERIDETENNIQIKPSGPTLSFPLGPITHFRSQEIQTYADKIVEFIGSFVDQTKWQNGWFKLSEILKNLPINPEPEYTEIIDEPERKLEIINILNEKFVGDGARILIE